MDQAIWLEMLRLEIEELDETKLIEPYGDPGQDERVVGVIQDRTLQKLWTLCEQRREAQDRLELDMRYARNADSKVQAKKAAMRAAREAEAIKAIFWVLLCEMFAELADQEHIGVRSGWRAVWYPPRPSPFPWGLLDRMEGHG